MATRHSEERRGLPNVNGYLNNRFAGNDASVAEIRVDMMCVAVDLKPGSNAVSSG